ncbi:MAG: hypothetical protein WC956_10420 [bacterium]
MAGAEFSTSLQGVLAAEAALSTVAQGVVGGYFPEADTAAAEEAAPAALPAGVETAAAPISFSARNSAIRFFAAPRVTTPDLANAVGRGTAALSSGLMFFGLGQPSQFEVNKALGGSDASYSAGISSEMLAVIAVMLLVIVGGGVAVWRYISPKPDALQKPGDASQAPNGKVDKLGMR